MPKGLKRIDSISKDVGHAVRRTSIRLNFEEGIGTTSPIPGNCNNHDSLGSVHLTGGQSPIYRDAITLTSLVWHDALLSLGYTEKQYNFESWLLNAVKVPMVPLLMCFKLLDKQLLLSVADPNYRLGTFKQYLKSTFHGDVVALIKPLHRAMVGWFSYRDPDSFHALHECFSFVTRINLPDRKDLEMVAHADYIKGESSLQLAGFTTWEKKIISSWFPVSSESQIFNDFWPKHGPGSVADTKVAEKLLKYKAMGTDVRVEYLSKRLGEVDCSPIDRSKKLERISRVVFVPKSFDKLRTICMEPATLQWYQQGFLYAIMRYVERHPYLRRRIDLRNQDRSRRLAMFGSASGDYATIDLSSASDRVSWPLVRDWTSKSSLRVIAHTCRSYEWQIGEPGDKEEYVRCKTNKFAPMGSALCFPFECIVFASIVEAAIFEDGGRPRDSKYCVYGDDIIVETRYAASVIRRLEANGFIVNHDKSFTTKSTHNFRESCGGEYLDGRDMTPVRLSRKFSGLTGLSRETPSRVSALVDLASSLEDYPSARSYVIAALNKLPQNLRPLFDLDGRTGVKSKQPTNYHLGKPKYNADLQNFEVVHGALHKWEETTYVDRETLESKKLVSENLLFYRNTADEHIRLYEWARLTAHRDRLLLPEDLILAETMLPGEPKWTKSKSAAGPHSLTVLLQDLLAKPFSLRTVETLFASLKRLEWVLQEVDENVPEFREKIDSVRAQIDQLQAFAVKFVSLAEMFSKEKGKGC